MIDRPAPKSRPHPVADVKYRLSQSSRYDGGRASKAAAIFAHHSTKHNRRKYPRIEERRDARRARRIQQNCSISSRLASKHRVLEFSRSVDCGTFLSLAKVDTIRRSASCLLHRKPETHLQSPGTPRIENPFLFLLPWYGGSAGVLDGCFPGCPDDEVGILF